MKGRREKSTVSILALFILAATLTQAAGFNLGFYLYGVQINQSSIYLNDTPELNSTGNITVIMPITYVDSGMQNVTIQIPSNWTNGVGWVILENGVALSVNKSASQLSWEANTSLGNISLIFTVPHPQIREINLTYTNELYKKNISIESINYFENISANITINQTYPVWNLFEYNGSDFINKTSKYELNVSTGNALFGNFSSLVGIIQLRGTADCSESWTCTSWSDAVNSCGTRTCTDSNSCGTEDTKPIESITCPITSTSSTGGGGSGRGGSGGGGDRSKIEVEPLPELKARNMVVDPSLITFKITYGQIELKNFTITNTGESDLHINIDFSKVNKFAIISGKKAPLTLTASQSITYQVAVGSDTLIAPGIYSADIIIKSEGIEKRVKIIVEYESVSPLFDFEINAQVDSRDIEDTHIPFDVEITQISNQQPIQTSLVFFIIDGNGNRLRQIEEELVIINEAYLRRNISIAGLLPGSYAIGAELRYDNGLAAASDSFTIVAKMDQIGVPKILILVTAVLIMLITAYFLFQQRRLINLHNPFKKQQAYLDGKISWIKYHSRPKGKRRKIKSKK